MKKTLTANISGTVFHIEEDAYEALNRYLERIRARFAGTPGADEIMADIESRIAELFTERLDGRGQVVTHADVTHVIGVMGQPEDYVEGDEQAAGGGAQGPSGPHRKRLFRDADDRWVGGVLGGLAAYIGTDPLWLRLAFILLIFLGVGSPILVYLVMWVLVPPATTAAERLMMEGEPVTVENLKRTFEEGGQRFAKEVEDLGERWSKPDGSTRKSFRKTVKRSAHTAGTVLGKVIGIFLVMMGVGMGIALLGFLVGGGVLALDSLDATGAASTIDLGGLVFGSRQEAVWALITLGLILLIPTIGLLQAGLQLLFDLSSPRWLGWTLGTVWVLAMVVFVFLALRLANDFKRVETVRSEIPLEQPSEGVLHLRLHDPDKDGPSSWSWGYSKGRVHWEMDGMIVEGDSVRLPLAKLDIRRSMDDRFHLRVERRTQARSAKASQYRSSNISFRTEQRDDALLVSPWLRYPSHDKLRAQRLHFIVLVPEGGAVHIGTELGFMLDDVDNVTNTLDRDMVGRTWTMTSKGLDATARPGQLPQEEKEPEPTSEGATQGKEYPSTVSAIGARLPQLPMLPDLFALLRLPRLA